jgi:uncharacterized protein DUF4013
MSTSAAAPAPGQTLDFGRGIRFVFDDPDWVKKVLIGAGMMILSVFIIGSLWLMGYWVRLIRRAASGEDRPLPEWDDLGGMLVDGLKGAGIYCAYLFAFLIPLGCVVLTVVILGGGAAHLTRGSEDAAQAVGALAGLGVMGLYGVMWLVMIVLMVYLPAALTRFALTLRFGAGFELGENFSFIRRNLLNYVLALVLYLVGSFVAQFGVLLCCIGVFPASFWALCLLGWGLGETARRDAAPLALTAGSGL